MQADITLKKLRAAHKKLLLERKRGPDALKEKNIPISKVAALAGFSNALIHNKYPIVAEEIRAANKRPLIVQKQKKIAELVRLKLRNSELNAELKQQKKLNTAMAAKNSTLILINKSLQERLSIWEANIPTIPSKK